MADQNTQFYAILTHVGAAKQANADALGIPWKLSQIGVGDANGTEPIPSANQTQLINEWRRAPLNQLKVDDHNGAIIVAEQIIPAEVGGKWIREIALYDADGDMVAVANCPPTFKPLLSQGSGRTQVVRLNLLVSNSANVELKIDPSVVLATREYADRRLAEALDRLNHKHAVRAATTAPIALTGLQTLDGVSLVAGDRVLVKDQEALYENGIYVAKPDTWVRASDANDGSKVPPGLLVSVQQGTVAADTLWKLITDAPLLLGITPLIFRDITDGFARLLSPAFLGEPTTPTPPRFDASHKVVNAEFVQRTLGNYAGCTFVHASRTLAIDDLGKRLELSAGVTITLPDQGTVPLGVAVLISANARATTAQVTVAPGDRLAMNNQTVSTPYRLAPGGDFIAIREIDGWRCHGGSEPLRSSALFSSSLGVSGWAKRPDGLIEQWGQGQTNDQGLAYITFPLAFPTRVLNIAPTHIGTGSLMHNIMDASVTKTGCQLRVQNGDMSAQAGWIVWYRALGY